MSNPYSNIRSPNSKTLPTLIYPAQPNPSISGTDRVPAQVLLTLSTLDYHPRHQKQLSKGKIARLNNLNNLIIDATEYCACYEVDDEARGYRSLNDESIFQSHLYLFSVLIAFEWQPSLRSLQRVKHAAKKASNFLYDVTDGFMAIGQVLLGGADLLDVADIQVMASNRFHPRAWNGALHYPHKYQPIRLGRGLWRKDQGFVLQWDESDAHQVLVHEWGHYALGLVDEYLGLARLDRSSRGQRLWQSEPTDALTGQNWNKLTIVAPSIALPIDSIMSTLVSSELIPRHERLRPNRRKYILDTIRNHFPKVNFKKDEPMDGPAELPLELPVFPRETGLSAASKEVQLSSKDLKQLKASLTASDALELVGNCWMYILKPASAPPGFPDRVIGQGVIGKRDWDAEFILLGAAVGDQIVVVAPTEDRKTRAFRVQVMCGEVGTDDRIAVWYDVTPDVLPDFIDVLPEMRPGQEQLPTKLRVQIETSGPLPAIAVAALGEVPRLLYRATQTSVLYPDGNPHTRWVSRIVKSNHLDGHVLLRWDDGKLYICGYSHGGGPCTSGGGICVSYTAGSYEGNSMIFYLANYDASDSPKPRLKGVESIPQPDQNTRIVSTVMPGGPQYLPLPSGDEAEARSYIFSLGSNQPLGALSGTLVLYYDYDARKPDGDLLIYRWGGSAGWRRLTTYMPEGQPYVCIPLDQATPETSGDSNNRPGEYFDRYRIYWTPR